MAEDKAMVEGAWSLAIINTFLILLFVLTGSLWAAVVIIPVTIFLCLEVGSVIVINEMSETN